jgi:NADPH:quinone reductase
VKAAGINFAESELIEGKYRVPKTPPFTMGFEAAGIVEEVGSEVGRIQPGDKVTGIVSSGGYAEYATAEASLAIPIPRGISFAEASTIPIQGLSAYALLKFAAKPQPSESILVQAAAGGVGLYLVQLAKILGAKTVIALAGSPEKVNLVEDLGADFAVNYAESNWLEQVRTATQGTGVDIVLEAASGEIGAQSFKLLAPFGRVVIYGARNIHDTFGPDRLQQLIYNNQSAIGFNIPSLRPEQIGACVPELLRLISDGRLRLFASHSYPLVEVRQAFEALRSRHTIGRVFLTP